MKPIFGCLFAALSQRFIRSFCHLLLKVLYLSPPLEHARAAWIHQFHAYLHTAAGLPRLRSKSFAVLGVSVSVGCRSQALSVWNDCTSETPEHPAKIAVEVAAFASRRYIKPC